MDLPGWLVAGLWGWFSAASLILGATIAYLAKLPKRLIAAIMAFGSGVLISAIALELMEDAYRRGGFVPTAIGFLSGAVFYTAANLAVSRYGAKHRKRSDGKQPSESKSGGSGLAIAIGALLDGIPESIVIGLSLLSGKNVSIVAVVAIFLSNLPEGLSSSAGMKASGRSAKYIFGVWGGIAALSGLASLAGYAVFNSFPPQVIGASIAVAAGGILAMLVDTMIPEAFSEAHDLSGLITVVGFLCAFILSKQQR